MNDKPTEGVRVYKLITMAQDEECLIFNLHTGDLKHIYWCLTTTDNKTPIENLTSYKQDAAIDEFEYCYVDKEQLERIADEIFAREANGLEIRFLDFNQLRRCIVENKSILDIIRENNR